MDHRNDSRSDGQILVLFALSLVVMIAMVGLILDGGGAYAQRRAEQNAADTAALAAANDLIVNQGSANWQATALSFATQNGYTNGVGNTTVTVTCVNCPGQVLDNSKDGVQVTVTITSPHRNNFASIVGMSNWNVSTTATSLTGWPNTAHGPAPFIVSTTAFDPSTGLPSICTSEATPCDLLHPVNDTPTHPTEFTWTDFHYDTPCHDPGNVNDNELQSYLAGSASFDITLQVGCYIAQHNDGIMNNIVAAIKALVPLTLPVPIVDTSGNYLGWASFTVTDAEPDGRNGTISGYFETGFQDEQLDVTGAGFGTSTYGGTYKLKLIN
jgi:Flp pilus assembly protein TadG